MVGVLGLPQTAQIFSPLSPMIFKECLNVMVFSIVAITIKLGGEGKIKVNQFKKKKKKTPTQTANV